MADEQDEVQVEEEVLELTEVVEAAEVEEEQEAKADDDEEEVVVSFGDEAAPASEEAPEWVRDLRKQYREVVKERDELKKQVQPATPKAGPKPTILDDGIDGDDEILVEKVIEWTKAVAAEERAKSAAQKADEEAQARYQAKVETYGTQKTELAVKDFDTAEAEVLAALTPAQQAILIEGAQNKAKLVYALGKHPEKLRELASLKDNLIEFAFAASKLEAQTKMERRPRTTPESVIRGSAPLSGQGNKELERLEAEAERTGDRTKLIAHRRKLKAQGKG